MPAGDNTPAPSRRFLPPSTSSTVKSSGPASARRNPFQGPRSTQLPPSATPFVATPRFQRPGSGTKDDIQTSFEDEIVSPTSSPIGFTAERRRSLDIGDNSFVPASPPYSRDAQDEDEANQYPGLAGGDSSPLQHRQRVFTPFRKKRKLSHVQSRKMEPIAISSSPEYDGLHDIDAEDDGDSLALFSGLNDGVVQEATFAEKDESNKSARFRSAALNATDSAPHARTIFKTAIGDPQTGPSESGPVLPDIFSPSRRKGKREYLPGGNAELVRSWILNVAAKESQGVSLLEETITATKVQRDTSGRFVIVADANGARWLLPEQQQNSLAGLRPDWSDLGVGSTLLIKGEATRWSLQIDPPTLKDVVVAAYWELLPTS